MNDSGRPGGGRATSRRSARFRAILVDTLRREGAVHSAQLEAAFLEVPRERFAPPGLPLSVVYDAESAIGTKTDEYGITTSSVSAPAMQALMIEQAEIRPGMSVLEIGSGGYNAALLAEMVGPGGRVVSVDIDPDIVEHARRALTSTGYGEERVTVVHEDAEHAVPDHAPFDRIIVTVGAWDIPPSWREQLAADGRIVVPLRMHGITRSLALRPEAGHLVSTSAEPCVFVDMQGEGSHETAVYELSDPRGDTLLISFDDGDLEDPSRLDGVLGTPRAGVWSGVEVELGLTVSSLHLWLAGYAPGFCRLMNEGVALTDPGVRSLPYAMVADDSIAYLTTRERRHRVELGAYAYGPHAAEAAEALAERLRAWGGRARPPVFRIWPADTDPALLPAGDALVRKTHTLITIAWP